MQEKLTGGLVLILAAIEFVLVTLCSAAPQSDNKVASLTGLALLAAAVVPEIAEAAQPGVSPSLKNLLLSVVAGGSVLTVIGVAVAGVSTFDPVKRK
jgi:Sec-independent protein secretion pathway component TatC